MPHLAQSVFFGDKRHVATVDGSGYLDWPGLESWLPTPLRSLFRAKVDFLEVDGEAPVAGVSAEWTAWLYNCSSSTDGALLICPPAPLLFDPANKDGTTAWGSAGKGAAVVTKRGDTTFEEMARNAEASGAAALVVVDNSEVMGGEKPPLDPKPLELPAILVPARVGELLLSERCKGLKASIVRR
eukprot:gnl/TRDRNA2_/TRDRNA2_46976_c0_seq1.p1 gnl/TRDRNA2_/TRDRNA2_46976_c0~~gnl/TRDRNA2_/TRDRNA2_46976_c0_seq1.p1  ORF type:complete len:185 (-),score=36.93 gnl/TRDRNA2_/TRDRNA2_46976_c0_seq1:47-601(-)